MAAVEDAVIGAEWICDGQTVLLTGATGSGKSYLVQALGHQACRLGLSTRHYRVSRLLDELAMACADGSYPMVVQRLAQIWLLVLDDRGLVPLSGQGRHDLLVRSDNAIGMARNVRSLCRNR